MRLLVQVFILVFMRASWLFKTVSNPQKMLAKRLRYTLVYISLCSRMLYLSLRDLEEAGDELELRYVLLMFTIQFVCVTFCRILIKFSLLLGVHGVYVSFVCPSAVPREYHR